jgi:hypothetical protein
MISGLQSLKNLNFVCIQQSLFHGTLCAVLQGIWSSCDGPLTYFLGLLQMLVEPGPSFLSDTDGCVWPVQNTAGFQKFFTPIPYWVHRRHIFIVHVLVIVLHGNSWLCLHKPVNTLGFFLWCRHFISSAAVFSKIWNERNETVLTQF